MRLDFFLPVLRPSGANGLPAQPGIVRRVLKRLGPTWQATPVRRVIQVLSLLLFLALFFHVCWPYSAQPDPHPNGWPAHYAANLRAKEFVAAESFLALDPLVSISTALAARTWVWSLAWAGVIVAISLFMPRSFCGYLCPLGTLIDLFDSGIARRVTRFQLKRDGWWIHVKYYVLAGTLAAALCGVLLAGFVAAIPVITRGLMFAVAPLQLGVMRGWHQIPPLNAGYFVSIALCLGVFAMSFWRPRFWCRHVCPSGAVFSVLGACRISERRIGAGCTRCGQCIKNCPADAIKADFTTRTADCTFCQTCGGICPAHAIKFVGRWDAAGSTPEGAPAAHEIPLARRGFLTGVFGSLLIVLGMRRVFGSTAAAGALVRPPGSVPEEQFLQLCIRCAECFKACPNSVLQPVGGERGLDALWTPEVVANWSGCEASCNACGQVCPTGAIRALPLAEKKAARMGLALVNLETCLPYAGREACRMCVDECDAAGYSAIEFMRVRVETDDSGMPVEGSGFAAPVVVPEKCVGCGLCQTRCYQINAKTKRLLRESAIVVVAGPGREDRLMSGSYLELRKRELARRQQAQHEQDGKAGAAPGQGTYLPDFLK